jgi:hypothetical protein
MTLRRSQRTLLLLALAAPTSSCLERVPNPDHCWWARGDQTCDQLFDGVLPYCSTDHLPLCEGQPEYGCVGDRPKYDECYSPCGGGLSILEDSLCEAALDTTGESGNGDGDGDTGTGDGDGDGDPLGGATLPVSCEIECPADHYWSPFDHQCLPLDMIVEVSFGDSALVDAVEALPPGPIAAKFVLDYSILPYRGGIEVGVDQVIVIDGVADFAPPRWESLALETLATVSDGGTLIITDMELRSSSNAISVTGLDARVWLERSQVLSDGLAVIAQSNAEAELHDCFVSGGQAALASLAGAHITGRYVTGYGSNVDANAVLCIGAVVELGRSLMTSVGMANSGCTYTPSDEVWIQSNLQPGELFVDAELGDLHLAAPQPTMSNFATRVAGDPLCDFDGDRIPTLGYPGADQPQ